MQNWTKLKQLNPSQVIEITAFLKFLQPGQDIFTSAGLIFYLSELLPLSQVLGAAHSLHRSQQVRTIPDAWGQR